MRLNDGDQVVSLALVDKTGELDAEEESVEATESIAPEAPPAE